MQDKIGFSDRGLLLDEAELRAAGGLPLADAILRYSWPRTQLMILASRDPPGSLVLSYDDLCLQREQEFFDLLRSGILKAFYCVQLLESQGWRPISPACFDFLTLAPRNFDRYWNRHEPVRLAPDIPPAILVVESKKIEQPQSADAVASGDLLILGPDTQTVAPGAQSRKPKGPQIEETWTKPSLGKKKRGRKKSPEYEDAIKYLLSDLNELVRVNGPDVLDAPGLQARLSGKLAEWFVVNRSKYPALTVSPTKEDEERSVSTRRNWTLDAIEICRGTHGHLQN